MLGLENTKIIDLNNLTNLISLSYKGSFMPNITSILNNLGVISVEVSSDINDVEDNIVLPDLIKQFKNLGFDVTATIYEQKRDEQ